MFELQEHVLVAGQLVDTFRSAIGWPDHTVWQVEVDLDRYLQVVRFVCVFRASTASEVSTRILAVFSFFHTQLAVLRTLRRRQRQQGEGADSEQCIHVCFKKYAEVMENTSSRTFVLVVFAAGQINNETV
jgi:hypothetical protein